MYGDLKVKVTLNHEEVIQACQEWVQRHYGIVPTGSPHGYVTTAERGEGVVLTLLRVAIEFPNTEQPEGPYRTPARQLTEG